MHLRIYSPLDDGARVYALWQANLGDDYPLTKEVYQRYTSGRLSYDDGDGVVAEVNGDIVGFGLFEIDRLSHGTMGGPSITAVVVDASHRRQGLGRAILNSLEVTLRDQGFKEVYAGGNFHSFWPAISQDPPCAVNLFSACGYELGPECFDLVLPLTDFRVSQKSERTCTSS